MDQYRVIPTIAKILEKCICDQIGKYNLLSYCQSGFRSLHNTLPVLVDAAYSWSVNIDNGLVNGVVFIDLKKAFDMIIFNMTVKRQKSISTTAAQALI